MSTDSYLACQTPAGATIKPWLMLGAFNQDFSHAVQGLTYFERPGSPVGRTAMAEVIKEAKTLLLAAPPPCEGMETVFNGEPARWSLVRRPEKYLSWGTYNISNHLGAAFFDTWLEPEEPGVRQWTLMLRIGQHALVAVNGVLVFDSANSPVTARDGVYTYSFQAALKPGENRVSVGLFRLARMAQVGFRLTLDTPVQGRVALPQGMTSAERAQVERELQGLRLERDILYPEHPVAVDLLEAPAGVLNLKIDLVNGAGSVLRSIEPKMAGKAVLCQAAEIPEGNYTLSCRWEQDAKPLTGTTYTLRRVNRAVAPQGYERTAERKKMALENYADYQEEGIHRIWTQVARYALARQGLREFSSVDEAPIRWTCEFIADRKDCADFVIQGVLRLMFWEREKRHLSPEINALMKDTILGFKYWVDEPGDTVMYMGSENHRLLFHVAEWMAGLLFPLDCFTNSQQNGIFHAHKAFTYITEWLRQRGRFGLDEWHSNSYFPVCIAPLLNVYDFATHEGQQKLRQMTGFILDYMFFTLGADSYQGVWGTTHGRSYGGNIKYPEFEGNAALCWILFGNGSLIRGSGGMAPVSLGSSSYQVPEIIYKMAVDQETVVDSHIRQGISNRSARHADFEVYRTPDYMICGLQDHRKGEYESSTHVAQVTLGNKAVLFWSCPHTSGEGSGLRPDYWSGHTTLPRVIQYKNVMALTWKFSEIAWLTHCWFDRWRFDEVRFQDGWAFVRVGRGYAGIYSQNGLQLGTDGAYAGRELVCFAPENTWLVECGREADWGSFDAFVAALSAAKVEVNGDQITYASPSIGTFTTGWDVQPTVDGKPFAIKGYPLVESVWASSAFGSGELTLRYGAETVEYWFNQ